MTSLVKLFHLPIGLRSLPSVYSSGRLYSVRSVRSDLLRYADDVIRQPVKDSDDAIDSFCLQLATSSTDDQIELAQHLVKHHGLDLASLKAHASSWRSDLPHKEDYLMAKQLCAMATPSYKHLFEKLSRNSSGIKQLVNMRSILITHITKQKGNNKEETFKLKIMSDMLREMFLQWFSPALLQLQNLSWEATPAATLQAVARSKAVHPVRNWLDLKRRLHEKDRRCFVFTHPAMSANDPVIILYVALMDTIPCSMEPILAGTKIDYSGNNTEQKNKSAIFYSIVSQNKGLNGIDLGHSLIKRVLFLLRNELPELTEFSTLSPVPNFMNWLSSNIQRLNCTHSLLKSAETVNVIPQHIRKCVRANDHSSLFDIRDDLLRMAARYICYEKNRGNALDPVAHFHLRNGAEVYRINWLGDVSLKGCTQSASIMVNYRYWPDRLRKNAHDYSINGNIPMSGDVIKLLT